MEIMEIEEFIYNLKAGDRIDYLISLFVMDEINVCRCRYDRTMIYINDHKKCRVCELPIPKKWSTDITYAWKIVEKYKLTITPNLCHPVTKAKWCVDKKLKGENELWLVGGENAPIAICKAALLIEKFAMQQSPFSL